jgi:hypothetical protein
VKKQRDEKIMNGNDMARHNMITKFMGQVMGDMMVESHRMVMNGRDLNLKTQPALRAL